jgi:hypothetical protein
MTASGITDTNPSSSPFRLSAFFSRLTRWADARRQILLSILVLAYLAITLPNAYFRPLWHDELVTYNIASAPSLAEMLHEVREIDLNPPLLYILDYIAIRIPGLGSNDHLVSLAARLPSIAGGLLVSLGLFSLLSRRLGTWYGSAAVGLLWTTAFLPYTWENRPYALLCGLLMLSILAWERASQPQRGIASVGWSFLLALAMACTHFMGAYSLIAFLGTQLLIGLIRRRIDLPLCLAYLLPFAIPVYYFTKVSGYRAVIFPEKFQVSLISIPVEYGLLLRYSILILGGFLAIYMVRILIPRGTKVQSVTVPTTLAERLLLLGLLLEPAMAVVSILRSHGAFFLRYGLPGCIPIVILFTVFLYALFERSQIIGLFIACVSIVVAASSSFSALVRPQPYTPSYLATPGSAPAKYRSIEPDLPFVVASGLTFVEMNHREPADFLRRTWYLTDTPSAIQFAHATLFEGEAQTAQVFHFQSNVENLYSFQQKHPRFLVLGTVDYAEDWLLRKLVAQGSTVRHLGPFVTTYKDKDLFEVTVNPNK